MGGLRSKTEPALVDCGVVRFVVYYIPVDDFFLNESVGNPDQILNGAFVVVLAEVFSDIRIYSKHNLCEGIRAGELSDYMLENCDRSVLMLISSISVNIFQPYWS